RQAQEPPVRQAQEPPVRQAQVSQGWEIKKLGEVLKLEYGKPLSNDKRISNGIYPIYGANGEKGKTNEYYYDKKTIIVGRKGSAGEINLTEERFWPLDVTYFVTFDEKKYELLFLFHLLNYLELTKLAKGVKPGINRNEVYSISSRFPPLPEQQRIVAILDEAFAAIATAKANSERCLSLSKALFESYLQGVFSNGKLKIENGEWEEKKLNQISENLDSKRIPITKNVRDKGSIPYYGASGIVDYVAGYIFDEDLLCVSEDGANLLARTYPIAFSISGKTWVNNHAHILRFENIISQKYVELYLNSIKLDDFVSGMAQPKLNQAMLNKIPIPLPSLAEQQSIVQKLDALSSETKKLETIYQNKLHNLEELKKSILQKAFNGEL
ncbi:MAG: restriction endonuclease subunit S, partial [bacterium]